jgi:hypothetical protein
LRFSAEANRHIPRVHPILNGFEQTPEQRNTHLLSYEYFEYLRSSAEANKHRPSCVAFWKILSGISSTERESSDKHTLFEVGILSNRAEADRHRTSVLLLW